MSSDSVARPSVWVRLCRFALRWCRRLAVAAVLFAIFAYWASRTTPPVLPAGVVAENLRLSLEGREVAVTLYSPANRTEAPLVVVAHGFTRGRRYMAGWGAFLAGEGFLTAVPTQPALADHALNSRVLAALVARLKDGSMKLRVKPSQKTALVGFSMGGLTSLLAAARQPVDAWVGLDPVDMSGDAAREAVHLHLPCAVLRAEPENWNLHGNALGILNALPGPKLGLKVRGGTHLDAESPTDLLGQLACGFADEQRHLVFRRYTLAFLKHVLTGDAAAHAMLDGGSADPALTEVTGAVP